MQSMTMLLCQDITCVLIYCGIVLGAGETGEKVPICRGSYRHNHDIILCLHSGKALSGTYINAPLYTLMHPGLLVVHHCHSTQSPPYVYTGSGEWCFCCCCCCCVGEGGDNETEISHWIYCTGPPGKGAGNGILCRLSQR